MVLTTREALSLGAKVAAKLPLTRHLLQQGGTEIDPYMLSHHQQTLLQPATAAAVCLTATSSLIQGWGTRVPPILLLLLPAAASPQYLSNSKVGPVRPGDTRASPAVTPWSQAPTGLQDCYLSTSRATIRWWIVGFPPSSTIVSALHCPHPAPPEHLSLPQMFPYPRAPSLSPATATAVMA